MSSLKSFLSSVGSIGTRVLMLVSLAFLGSRSEPTEAKVTSFDALKHLVSIEVPREGSRGEWDLVGSGTLVDNGGQLVVVTAGHVVRIDIHGDVRPTVRVCGQDVRHRCEISQAVSASQFGDVGAVVLNQAIVKPAKVGAGLKIGDKVFVVGLPEGDIMTMEGQVLGSIDQGRFWVLAWCSGGSSGGGVFDSKGDLVAVVTTYRIEVRSAADDQVVIPAHEVCGVEEFTLQKS